MNDLYIGVPFSGVEKEIPQINLITTREDEAIAIASGIILAGGSASVFMQDSGLGNSLDVITSLLIPYGIIVNLIIGHRDSPEHHKIMGDNSMEILRLIGYESFRLC